MLATLPQTVAASPLWFLASAAVNFLEFTRRGQRKVIRATMHATSRNTFAFQVMAHPLATHARIAPKMLLQDRRHNNHCNGPSMHACAIEWKPMAPHTLIMQAAPRCPQTALV